MIIIATSPASTGSSSIIILLELRKLIQTAMISVITQILILNRRHRIKLRLHVIIGGSPHVLLLLLILVSGHLN